MNIPDELRYSADHEWVRVEGTTVRLGITDFAQDNLGDVVYVQLPDAGTVVTAGVSFSEVESTKSVSEIFAPVSGTVTEVNTALDDAPETLNRDPYGEGWICVIELANPSEVDELLDADRYLALISD
jgi:glycine cleavage system H protein